MSSALYDQQIVSRFYMAVDALYALGEIKSFRHFEREIGADHSVFYELRKNAHKRTFMHPAWLRHLVVTYSISADWLLVGEGAMFK